MLSNNDRWNTLFSILSGDTNISHTIRFSETRETTECRAPFPGPLSLLDGGPEPLPALLEAYGFVYDGELKRFRCDSANVAGNPGAILLTALGKNTPKHGRRLSPEMLRLGEALEAIQFTLFFENAPNPPMTGKEASHLFDSLLTMDNIGEDDVARCDIAPRSNDIPPVSHMWARCTPRNRDALWAATLSGWVGFTCSCSYLDYYLGAYPDSRATQNHAGGSPYDAVPNIGPWDIAIDDNFGND